MAQKEERLKRGEHAAEIRAEYQQVNGVEKQLYALERQEKEEEEAIRREVALVQECSGIYEKRDLLLAYYDLSQSMEELEKRKAAGLNRQKQLEKKLLCHQQDYLEQEKRTADRQHELTEAQSRYRRAVIGLAARLVEEGKPCPVCGSLEHPHVAGTGEDVPDEEQLNRLQEAYDQSAARLTSLHGQAAAARAEAEGQAEQNRQLADEENALLEKRGSFSEELVSFASIHNREEVREQAERYTGLIKGLEVRRQNKERLSSDKARLEKELAAAGKAGKKPLKRAVSQGRRLIRRRSWRKRTEKIFRRQSPGTGWNWARRQNCARIWKRN